MSRPPELLLTHGFLLAEDPKEQAVMKPYPALGLLYLKAWLDRAGRRVEVFDPTFATFADLEDRLSRAPSVLGVYANLMTRATVIRIINAARLAGWVVVVGGPEPANWPEAYLENGAHVVVVGEGERALEELLPRLAEGFDPERLGDVAGLVFLSADGDVLRTPERAKIADLDSIPWPARDAIAIDRYVEAWRSAHGRGSLNLITARGCPYRCNWCSHGVYGWSHRRRGHVDVADEIEHLRDRYDPDMLWIADDVFTINARWLENFAAEMARRELAIPFECITRADRFDERSAELLAQLGCFRVWIGSESGSQRVLDRMDRGVTLEQVRSAVSAARAVGIETGMFLMWGYEGEELSDIEATVDHVVRTAPDVFLTTVAYPIKGTGFHDRAEDRIVPDGDWATGSDRAVRLRGRRSRRFYSWVDRWLRHEVDLARRGPGLARVRAWSGARWARTAMALTARETEV